MRYTFILGEAFPHTNLVGKWVVGLSAILNDLVFVNNYLVRSLKESGDKPSADGTYFFRLTCSHFREAIKYIKDIDSYPEIVDFLKDLDPDVLKEFDAVKETYEPWTDSFVSEKIKPIRDKFFHYPNLEDQNESLERILEELKDLETGIKTSQSIKDLRIDFGDEIINAYCFNHIQDRLDLEKTVSCLVDSITHLMTFAQAVIGKYLGELPKGVITKQE